MMTAGSARPSVLALALAATWTLYAVPAVEAKGISFYCVQTGTARDGRMHYVFGPGTRFRPEACRLAQEKCRARGLRGCRTYGVFRKA